MVILIDTNVALDFLTVRQPFYQSAKAILQACACDNVQGYIAFHSLPNIFYILRKSYSDEDRRSMLEKLCLILRTRFHRVSFRILKTACKMNVRRRYPQITL